MKHGKIAMAAALVLALFAGSGFALEEAEEPLETMLTEDAVPPEVMEAARGVVPDFIMVEGFVDDEEEPNVFFLEGTSGRRDCSLEISVGGQVLMFEMGEDEGAEAETLDLDLAPAAVQATARRVTRALTGEAADDLQLVRVVFVLTTRGGERQCWLDIDRDGRVLSAGVEQPDGEEPQLDDADDDLGPQDVDLEAWEDEVWEE